MVLTIVQGGALLDDVQFRVRRRGEHHSFDTFRARVTDWWREGKQWVDHGGVSCVLVSNWTTLKAPKGRGTMWHKRAFGPDVIVGFSVEEASEWFGWNTPPGHLHYPYDNICVHLASAREFDSGYRLEINSDSRTATVLYRNGKEVARVPQDATFPLQYRGGHSPYSPRRQCVTLVKQGAILRALINRQEVLRYKDPDPLPFLRMTREGMKRLGTTIANVVAWDPRCAHHGVHPYDFYKLLRQELPEATGFVRGMAESVWEPSWLEGNAPVVYGSLAVHAQDDTYARIRALVDACPNRPLFIFAYINHNISLAQLLDAASRKPGEIEFLRLDEFMTKLRAARDTGMIGNDLYPVKEQCAGLLADEMRPQWASAVESVVDLGERVADSVDNCLAYYAAQPGGCAATDLTAAVQFELCQGAANLVKMACNGRGVFVGNRKKGVEDFLQLYSSAPDAQSIVEVSKWWHRWDRESVKSIETLRKAADRVLRVARWLEKVNKGWEPLPK